MQLSANLIFLCFDLKMFFREKYNEKDCCSSFPPACTLTVAYSPSIAPMEFTATAENKTETVTNETKTAEDDAMPEGPHDPTGFANNENRKSGVIRDDIMITCVCISDGENKVLLYSPDTLSVSESVWNQIASRAQKKLGIPGENIILNCTDTHSAPQLSTTSLPSMKPYMKLFYPKVLEAATRAVADLDRCEMKIGRAYIDGLNYVRRYLNVDGTYAGGTDLMYGKDPALFRHETEADEEIQVIVFDRVNQKNIVLCNWQCYTTTIGSSTGTVVSADWVYPLRTVVEEENRVHFSFHQGAGGNLVPGGKLWGENKNSDYYKIDQKGYPVQNHLRVRLFQRFLQLRSRRAFFCQRRLRGAFLPLLAG